MLFITILFIRFLITNYAQATLAVDFDVGFAIKEKVSLQLWFHFTQSVDLMENLLLDMSCVILKCHCAILTRIFQVIPRAVLYFTGDIFGDDDEDFEDCEDEDSEEED